MFAGRQLLVGNLELLIEHNIAEPAASNATGTVVYVAFAGQFIGSLVIADRLRSEAADTVAGLHRAGIKTVMLTGDREVNALAVARQSGVQEVHADLLPADKVAWLEKLIGGEGNRKGKVMFIGDGVNDAPVITRADIGVAMGGLGSDAAIEAADVVVI